MVFDGMRINAPIMKRYDHNSTELISTELLVINNKKHHDIINQHYYYWHDLLNNNSDNSCNNSDIDKNSNINVNI